ncbi:MAG TPA: neuraminidase-like domain-containing protein, partial [Pseudomonadota bacterium]|nr:neuraminidase-like domain-containing protein [Pseudomonadota bacterium]
QRDALVSHVMHLRGFDRMEQLYEYFLVDPGMEPVVQTSRIRLAIASVQLFIQRSLLNLEPKVHPSTIDAKQWEWMKRYRVWEANRKIFLFPENWLEPEFRDDKTHLFAELEGALLQGDVSSDLVDDAFLNYLKKLDELARLDICAMHIEDDSDPAQRVLHVFGRTFSEPHKYFYRRYAHQTWTPWEPVSAQIEGDHLAPVVWRDRLYLFWVTFADQADPNPSAGTATGSKKLTEVTLTEVMADLKDVVANKQVDVQLHWSEYLNGEWTTRESSGFSGVISTTVPASFRRNSVFVHVSREHDPVDGSDLGIFVNLGGAINSAFYIAGRNSVPEAEAYRSRPVNPFNSANTEEANRYLGSGSLEVSFRERITTEPGKTPPPSNPRTTLAGVAAEQLGSHRIASICIPVHLGAESSAVRCCIRAAERCILAALPAYLGSVGVHVAACALDRTVAVPVFCRIGIRRIAIRSRIPVVRLGGQCGTGCDVVLTGVLGKTLARAFPCGTGHSCDLAGTLPSGGTSDSWIVIITVCPTAAAVWIAITIPVAHGLYAAIRCAITLIWHAVVGIVA